MKLLKTLLLAFAVTACGSAGAMKKWDLNDPVWSAFVMKNVNLNNAICKKVDRQDKTAINDMVYRVLDTQELRSIHQLDKLPSVIKHSDFMVLPSGNLVLLYQGEGLKTSYGETWHECYCYVILSKDKLMNASYNSKL